MQNSTTKTASMVEGGILASIAIVFALISVYLPFLGVIVNLIWPVPILLLGVRHGLKASLMCLAVAGIIIAILINPIQAISVVFGFGFIGIALGYAINQAWSPLKTMLVGTGASLLSKGAVLLISIVLMGINPLTVQLAATGQALEQALSIYQSLGFTAEQLQEIRTTMETTIGLLKYIMPAGFALASVVDTYINYLIAKKILARLGNPQPEFTEFRLWQIPGYVLWIYGVSLLLVTFYNQDPTNILYLIGVNVQMVTNVILLIQGLSIAYYYIHYKNWPNFLKSLIVILLFSNQFLVQVVVLMGAFDVVFDYRRLNTRNK